jgi:16S rRNA (guanine527-N7)-methyltransferase
LDVSVLLHLCTCALEEAFYIMEYINEYFGDFTNRQRDQFSQLQTLYAEWNEKINVISRKDIDQLYLRHVLHSLSIAAVFGFPAQSRIIDLGTGGGFPGVPLAIFFPEVEFLLVDSINKKLTVINEVAKALDLKNIQTRHTRVEDIKDVKCDWVVSRAVAPLQDLVRWSRPLIRRKDWSAWIKAQGADAPTVPTPGLICLKGGDLSQEIVDSRTKPNMIEIADIFQEDFFKEKYLLQVSL